MDVYCTRCGEPWEIDTFWDVAHEQGNDFADVQRLFARHGCSALGSSCNPETLGSMRAQASAALHDLLGDDIDGIASELSDAEYLGILED